jgi:TRAP transporter TAXI family solute receptor
VGTPGSGTFAIAERAFGKLGIWDRITRVPLLGAAAGGALADGRVDAFIWTGPFPDRVTIEAAIRAPVHIIDIHSTLARTDFFTIYPYFSRYVIPGGAYTGVAENTATLGIPNLWYAHRNVSAALVQRMVEAAYSLAGHEHMLKVHAASSDMTPRRALQGVSIPLHPGADAHWRAVGLEIPERLRPR